MDNICVAFAEVIDAKSPFTYRHSDGVAEAALDIGRLFGLSAREMKQLRRAALLHDIGKLSVSNAILEKPAKLTADEWKVIRNHPYYTLEILKRIRVFEGIADDAAAHHERLDGTGDWRGWSGELMSLSASHPCRGRRLRRSSRQAALPGFAPDREGFRHYARRRSAGARSAVPGSTHWSQDKFRVSGLLRDGTHAKQLIIRLRSTIEMNSRYRLALAVLIIGFFSTSVFAQNFYSNTASARSMALGGVYVPSASDPLDALTANPAGLTYLGGRTLDLTVNTVFPRGAFSNSVNSDAQLSQAPGVLPYGAFGMPIGHSRFSFGIGFAPDLMSVADWHYVDAPGVAGASYGLQEQKSAILAGRAMGGLGISLGKKLSIGVTLGADYNTNTLDAPYIFQSQPVLKGLKTLLDLNTAGYGWNGSVGALIRPSKKVELGLAWKSSTVILSNGTASGNVGAQFTALGLGGVPSAFNYTAQVRNVLPQSVLGSVSWYANPRWVLAFQTNWVNWHNAFVNLPVTLTGGTNAAINGLVNSTSLVDGVPLNWKDQYSFHVGAERLLTEETSLRFGFSHENDPIPSSTLSPLTAAIMSNQISTGFVFHPGHSRFEISYAFDPTAQAKVQQSALLSGEYSNSTVKVGTQSLMLNYGLQF